MGIEPKKILFLTGTRADFGKMKPLIEKVEGAPEFEAYVFATGMHLLARYGSTVQEIENAGIKRIYSYINQDGSINSQMDLVLANTIQGLGHYIREFPPDLIVVHGDRIEALAGAIVGALNNIFVVHVEGGEVSGTVDELIRHAVSKLSHIHFVSNEQASNRLIQMGEDENLIFVIGSPEIDIMLSDKLPLLPEVRDYYEIEFSEYGIFIYHPVVNELGSLGKNIETVIDALLASSLNFVVIYPNNDAGSDIIMEALKRIHDNQRFRILPSARFEYFLSLMKNAKVIVGNSSAGVREAPVFGVPTVNIGTRQINRYRYTSILDVAEDKEAICKVLNNLPESVPPSMHFGRGESAKLFIAELLNSEFWSMLRHKQFKDLKPGLLKES